MSPEAFLAWCGRPAAESRLANPLPAVRWNLHKRYLAELEAAVGYVLERVVDRERGDLLYARVDVMDDDGAPRLSELELMEPSLFLLQEPRALDRLVAALV